MDQWKHELSILVTWYKLSNLLQYILWIIQTFSKQSITPFIRYESQVTYTQVDQFIHQIHIQHTLITDIQVKFDLT